MILYGGVSEIEFEDSNIYHLDLDTNIWSVLDISANTLKTREMPAMKMYSEDTLVIYGGKRGSEYLDDVNIVDLKEMRVVSPEISNVYPGFRT